MIIGRALWPAIHDMYAYTLGALCVAGVCALVFALANLHIPVAPPKSHRIQWYLKWAIHVSTTCTSRALKTALKAAAVVALCVLVLPVVACFALSQYAPASYSAHYPTAVVLLYIGITFTKFIPANSISNTLALLERQPIAQLDLMLFLNGFVAPICGAVLVFALVPAFINAIVNAVVLQWVGVGVWIGLCGVWALGKGREWMRGVRDDVYLVGRVLHNVED